MRYSLRKHRRFFGKTMVFCVSLICLVFGVVFGICYEEGQTAKLSFSEALKCIVFYGGDVDALQCLASVYPLISESEGSGGTVISSWEVTYYHDEETDAEIPVFYGETVDRSGIAAAMGAELIRVTPGTEIALKNTKPEKMSVLIYCTHTSESYDGEVDENGRGEVLTAAYHLADTLKNVYGIGAVVSDTVHDSPDWYKSYANSKVTASKMLEEYPDADFIIDLHRDSGISKEDCTVTVNGKTAAKLLLVVGSDVNLEHPHWEENWKKAKALGEAIDEVDPSLLRGIRVQKGRYNQHLSTNCILLEVGTNLNTLDEAKYSAELMAKAISEYLQIQE